MQIEFISQDPHLCEVRMDNLTVAEIMRVYLNEQGIRFAAWRRDHLTKPLVFRIESTDKTVKKSVSEAVSAITKDLDSLTKQLGK